MSKESTVIAEQSSMWLHRPIRAQSFEGSFDPVHALEFSYIAKQSVIGVMILAARPKIGKTAFILSIAQDVAKSGKTVVFLVLKWETLKFMNDYFQKQLKFP